MESDEKKTSKSWRQYLPLLFISYTVLIVIQAVLFILSYIDFPIFLGGVLVTIVTIPIVYFIGHIQIKYQQTKSLNIINRIAFILGPALLAFPVTFISVFLIFGAERMNALSSYIGYWPTVILEVVVPMIAGGFIGYLIGKRRNFEPYR